MKNKLIIFTVSIFAVFSIVTACNDDILTMNDPGSGSVEGFFNTADDFKLGVNGIYNSLTAAGYFTNFWGGNYFHMNMEFDVISDNMVGQGASWKGYSDVSSGLLNPNTDGITAWKWSYGLGAISKVNQMLAVLPNVDFGIGGSEIWEAELKFLRGFVYGELANFYGGVPLILTPLTAEEANELSRSTQLEAYAQALSDLEFAAENLGLEPNQGDFGRPTKDAANTAIGFIHLDQKNYSLAAASFKKVADNEGTTVSLATQAEWENLHRGMNEQNAEIIWAVQNASGEEGTGDYIPMGVPTSSGFNGWSGQKFTKDLVDAFEMANGMKITDPASGYDPNDPLSNRDPRLRMTLYFEGDEYDGGTIGDAEFGQVCCNGDTREMGNVGIYPAFPRKYTAIPGTEAFDQMNGVQYGSPIDLVIYRYADVLLAHAEALNESGDTAGAYAGVNSVRNRVGLPDLATGLSQSEMREAILHERRVELALEGKRYFDLKRAGILMETVNSNQGWDLHGGADYKEHYDLWPIPGATVDNSPNIEQNPGY